jgi:hypothetical protein
MQRTLEKILVTNVRSLSNLGKGAWGRPSTMRMLEKSCGRGKSQRLKTPCFELKQTHSAWTSILNAGCIAICNILIQALCFLDGQAGHLNLLLGEFARHFGWWKNCSYATSHNLKMYISVQVHWLQVKYCCSHAMLCTIFPACLTHKPFASCGRKSMGGLNADHVPKFTPVKWHEMHAAQNTHIMLHH